MSRYLVKFAELKEKNEDVKAQISKIEECIRTMEEAKLDLEWEGPSKEKFDAVYSDSLNKLNTMLANLKVILGVSEQFHTNFSEGYNKIQKGFSSLQDEMVMRWKIQK